MSEQRPHPPFRLLRHQQQQQYPPQLPQQPSLHSNQVLSSEFLTLENNTNTTPDAQCDFASTKSMAQMMGVRPLQTEPSHLNFDDATLTSVLQQIDIDAGDHHHRIPSSTEHVRPISALSSLAPLPSSSSVWNNRQPQSAQPLQHDPPSSLPYPPPSMHSFQPPHALPESALHQSPFAMSAPPPSYVPAQASQQQPQHAEAFSQQGPSYLPETYGLSGQAGMGPPTLPPDMNAGREALGIETINASENNAKESDSQTVESPSAKDNSQKRQMSYFRQVFVPLPDTRFRYMSKAELSIVIRQQLLQLQARNPMDDDFYYQVFSARSGGPWKGVGFPGMENIPNRFRNADGSPILPEGTLGRIAVSGIRKPRKLVQLQGPSNSSEESSSQTEVTQEDANAFTKAKRFMFAHRSLDYVVEEGIRCIMDVEDVDNLLFAVPTTAEEAEQQRMLQQQRTSLGQRLAEHLGLTNFVDDHGNAMPHSIPLSSPPDDHLAFKYGSIDKGRNLTVRALMMLSPEEVFRMLHVIFHRLYLFAIPEKPSPSDSTFPIILQQHMKNWAPQQVTVLFSAFMSSENLEQIVKLARSKAGSFSILEFCERGHQLRGSPYTPPADVSTWMDLFTALFEALAGSFDQIVAQSIENDVPEELLSTEEDRWRILADMSSHASPQLLSTINRSEDFIQSVHAASAYSPPARFFASMLAPLPPQDSQ